MKNPRLTILLAVLLCEPSPTGHQTYAQQPTPSNVQALAIYRFSPASSEILSPQYINFTVTDPVLIDSMVSAINFTVPRDGSDLLSLPNAYVYLRYKDNTIGIFELFDLWRHICKRGYPGRCYAVSPQGQMIFEAHVQ